MDGFYDGVDGVIVMNCYSGSGLIWKKAIAINRIAIQMRRKPTRTIVKNAPTSNSRPAVENRVALDFAESVFSDFLMKRIATLRLRFISK